MSVVLSDAHAIISIVHWLDISYIQDESREFIKEIEKRKEKGKNIK